MNILAPSRSLLIHKTRYASKEMTLVSVLHAEEGMVLYAMYMHHHSQLFVSNSVFRQKENVIYPLQPGLDHAIDSAVLVRHLLEVLADLRAGNLDDGSVLDGAGDDDVLVELAMDGVL